MPKFSTGKSHKGTYIWVRTNKPVHECHYYTKIFITCIVSLRPPVDACL